ncbi:MAG: methyltransferase domain-containing protein [Rhodobacteraceae bacterium]|nr:MAG: methyltransferase domain-containing protein [Paracoccaceae bacterium]
MKPRRAALSLVAAVLDEARSLDAAKADPALARLSGPEKARAGDLASAVLRWVRPIDALAAEFMRRPLDARATTARDALRLAVAEVGALGAAPHAAVDAAVRLTKEDRRSAPLAGLVNAVARKAALAAPRRLATPEAIAATAPAWLADALRAAWGEAAAAILAAQLADAPVDLTLRDPAEARRWADTLGAETLPTGSLRLMRPAQLTTSPGYAEGAWWAQDAAAAIPARLLGDVRARRALDLCAAPGGKTLQLAAAGARVTAVDASAERLARLSENLARTGLSAAVAVADALAWRADPFEAVLLDAPCTATGTIRRHPDLPHLKRASDVGALAALQDRLLDAAWALTAPGGLMVFCTCSLLPEEGEARSDAFLRRTPDAALQPIAADEVGDAALIDEAGRLRTRPDLWRARGGLDGFFAARFRKAA